MPKQPIYYGGDAEDALENLRQGTRRQYESDWVAVVADTDVAPTRDFTHELGEVPMAVDVLRADHSEGYAAVECPSTDVSVSKGDSTITLTVPTSVTTTYYYKVRAM